MPIPNFDIDKVIRKQQARRQKTLVLVVLVVLTVLAVLALLILRGG